MSLPHVLLGLLEREPRSGYDLARALREEADPVWSAGFSRIYPALAALRRRGWVRLRILGPGRGPRRHLYRATAEGRRELRRWLQLPPPAPSRRNDEGLARVAFLDVLPPSDRRRVLAESERALASELSRLRALPHAPGSLGLARRAAIEELDAVRRFLRAGGAEPRPDSASGRSAPGRDEPRKKR